MNEKKNVIERKMNRILNESILICRIYARAYNNVMVVCLLEKKSVVIVIKQTRVGNVAWVPDL